MLERFNLRTRLWEIGLEYRKSGKKGKAALLDEYVKRTGYSRKYLAEALRERVSDKRGGSPDGRGKTKRYSEASVRVLWQLKETTGGMAAVRLKAMLPRLLSSATDALLPGYTPAIGEELLAMSPRTMTNRLREHARKNGKRWQTRRATAHAKTMRGLIPVSISRPLDAPVGTIEVDTVQHKDNSGEGVTCWTLTITCTVTGWTATLAIMGCSAEAVVFGMEDLLNRLPFTVVSAHSDNGGEFINEQLYKSFDRKGIAMTRGRPGRCNDNPRVEQRNFSHVRQLVGYSTYDTPAQQRALQRVYDLYMIIANLFEPSQRLKSKTRDGAKVTRVMDAPQTPLDRLVALTKQQHKRLPSKIKQLLRQRDAVNVLELYNELNAAIKLLDDSKPIRKTPTTRKEMNYA